MKFTWTVFRKAEAVKTVGRMLNLDLPLLGIEGITAKVDTGAFSGALHATKIREVADEQGVKHLRFCPLGSADHLVEMDEYHKRRVKSSNGVMSIRYAIDTEVRIMGQIYPITLTLTNRRFMKREILIGRKFLRLHGFLVDVTQRTQ